MKRSATLAPSDGERAGVRGSAIRPSGSTGCAAGSADRMNRIHRMFLGPFGHPRPIGWGESWGEGASRRLAITVRRPAPDRTNGICGDVHWPKAAASGAGIEHTLKRLLPAQGCAKLGAGLITSLTGASLLQSHAKPSLPPPQCDCGLRRNRRTELGSEETTPKRQPTLSASPRTQGRLQETENPRS